jgi:hypothetical protein
MQTSFARSNFGSRIARTTLSSACVGRGLTLITFSRFSLLRPSVRFAVQTPHGSVLPSSYVYRKRGDMG